MRPIECIRLAYGLVQIVKPDAVSRLVDAPSSRALLIATRILGARDFIQALALARSTGVGPRVGTFVDFLHSASAVAFAVVQPRYRRQATISAAVAAMLGIGERG